MDRIGPVRAGMVYYSLPIFAAIGSFLVLGERVNGAQLAGGALIIGGILAATWPHKSAHAGAHQGESRDGHENRD